MVVGHLYDRAGSYMPSFLVGLAAVALAAAIVSLFLRGDTKPLFGSSQQLEVAAISLEESVEPPPA